MSRSGVCYNDVEVVAENILKCGDAPTIEKIRLQLGTGSNSTIAKYLNEWKNQRLKAHPEQLPILSTLSNPIQEKSQQLWDALQQECEQKIAQAQEVAEQRIQDAHAAKAQAEQQLEQMRRDWNDLNMLLKEERQHAGDQERELIHLRQQTERYKEKNQQLEQHLTQIQADHQAHVTTLEKAKQDESELYKDQLQQWAARYGHEISEMKGWMETERHQRIVEIDHLKSEIKALQQETQKWQAESHRHRVEKEQLKASLYEEQQRQYQEVFKGLRDEIMAQVSEQQQQIREAQQTIVSNLSDQHHAEHAQWNELSSDLKTLKQAVITLSESTRV